jgi:hypothetical protein
MQLRTLFAALLLLALSTATLFGQARESFKEPLGTNLAHAEHGWAGPWIPFDGTVPNMFVVSDTGFSYNDFLNYPVTGTGNVLIGTLPSAWSSQRYGRQLANPLVNQAGKSYWLSWVVQYANWPNDLGWAFVGFYDRVDSLDKWNEGLGVGYSWQPKLSLGTQVDWGTWPPTPLAGNEAISNVIAQGDPHWLSVKVVMSGDTLSRVFLFIDRDPNGAAPDTATADAKISWNLLNGIKYLAVHMGGDGALKQMKVDEIAVDTTFAGLKNPTVYEPFGSSYKVGDGLGSVKDGWAGPWLPFDGGAPTMFAVTDTGFAYNDFLNYPVSGAGNFAVGKLPSAWSSQRYARKLANPGVNVAGKNYWLSFVVQYQNWPNDLGWGFVGLYDFYKGTDSLSATVDTIYKWRENLGNGYSWQPKLSLGTQVDWGAWPPTPLPGSPAISNVVAQGDPHWIAVKYAMSGDTLSRVYMFIDRDPAGAEPDTATADARMSWNLLHGLNYIAVHMGGDGASKLMKVDEIVFDTTFANLKLTTGIASTIGVPGAFELQQNYPNPFNPSTQINFSLSTSAKVTLEVFDLLGRKVASLINGETREAGKHTARFNAGSLSSGVYFYRLTAGNQMATAKMMFMK